MFNAQQFIDDCKSALNMGLLLCGLSLLLRFADMVEKTNLFENTNRVLDAAREAGLFVAFVSADLSPSGYRYPQRGEFCRFVAEEHEKGESRIEKFTYSGKSSMRRLSVISSKTPALNG